jgi:hypothetical protein
MADVSEPAERWWPWDRLGIDPTADSRAIRRVYARLLRAHHPETDPEGYQSLREAYEAALAEAAYADAEPAGEPDPPAQAPEPPPEPARSDAPGAGDAEVPLFARARMSVEPAAETPAEAAPAERLAVAPGLEPAPPPPTPPRLVVAPAPPEPPPGPASDLDGAADRILGAVDELLAQPRRMREPEPWAAILRQPEMDAIDVRHEVASSTLFRLIRFAAAQPWGAAALEEWHDETWRLLDSTFDWTGSEIALAQAYGEHELDLVMKPLRRALPRPQRPPAPARPSADGFADFMRRGLTERVPVWLTLLCVLLLPVYALYWPLRRLLSMPWWGIVLLVIGVQLVRVLAK